MMKEFAYFNFKVEGDEMPMLRHALMCCALTSKRSLENVSRVIFKSDFDKLKGSLQKQAIKLEGVLKTSWGQVDLGKHEHVQAYGKLAVRCVMFLLQKQKHGRDDTVWESFEEIVEVFAHELSAGPSPKPAAASSSTSPSEPALKNLLGASAAEIAILQHSHLTIGDKYCHKDHGDKIFVLKELSDVACKFVHTPISGNPVEVECEFKDCKQWKKTKKDMTQLCDAQVALAKLPENSQVIKDEWNKIQISHLLFEAYMTNAQHAKAVAFAIHPTGLLCNKKLKKKELQLYPLGAVSKLKDQSKLDSSKGLYVRWKGEAWSLQPYKSFTAFDKPQDPGILCPFTFVKSTEDSKLVNMALVETDFKGLTIPMLENTIAVDKDAWLYRKADLAATQSSKKRKKTS